MTSGWRFFATRLNGDGTETPLVDEIPLSGSEVVNVLSGSDTIAGKLSPDIVTARVGGERVFVEWSTALYAEKDGAIQAGGIVQSITESRVGFDIDAAGFVSYATGMPFDGEDFFVATDALDIVRAMWGHIQSHPRGNIGLVLDQIKSGVLLGDPVEVVDFETQSGETVTFEAGPIKLAWWLSDKHLGSIMTELAERGKFDWWERHAWRADGEGIDHHLHFAAPRAGRQRNDLQFVEGENIVELPEKIMAGEEYASEVWALGAGEGREMRRGMAQRPGETRLRRVVVVADKSARSHVAAAATAQRELGWRTASPEYASLRVRDWAGSLPELGDEIPVMSADGEALWHRVLSMTRSGESSDVTLSTVRTDKIEA